MNRKYGEKKKTNFRVSYCIARYNNQFHCLIMYIQPTRFIHLSRRVSAWKDQICCEIDLSSTYDCIAHQRNGAYWHSNSKWHVTYSQALKGVDCIFSLSLPVCVSHTHKENLLPRLMVSNDYFVTAYNQVPLRNQEGWEAILYR